MAAIGRLDAEEQRPVSRTGASGQSAVCPVKGYNDSISWGLLFKPHGWLWLISLAIFIDIATFVSLAKVLPLISFIDSSL